MSSFLERHRGTLIGTVIFFGVAALIWIESGGGGPAPGTPAPSFDLPVFGATTRVASRDLAGQPAVLDFWASWCGPCRSSLPRMDALATRYAGKARFYAVNADNEPANVISEFVKQVDLRMPVLLNGAALHGRYGTRVLPTTVVLDRGGLVFATFSGAVGEDAIAAALDRMP